MSDLFTDAGMDWGGFGATPPVDPAPTDPAPAPEDRYADYVDPFDEPDAPAPVPTEPEPLKWYDRVLRCVKCEKTTYRPWRSEAPCQWCEGELMEDGCDF